VLAGGALLALHLHRIINDLQLKVGVDVSLVGYDDPPFLSIVQPPIATVVQPLSEMAHAACKELKRLIASPWETPAVHLCQPELVLRDSAVAPRPTKPSL
jgi:DNA-binding LacI/PurR family transcriptional regulator